MELTLEAAFTPGAMVGHAAYLLLVLSMMMRIMWLLRVLVIASAMISIVYAFTWLKDPVGVFWETLLILVNVVQLSISYLTNRVTRFNPAEAAFVHSQFPGLSNVLKRKILRKGTWKDGVAGEVLTREGQPVDHLIYLATGDIAILLNGKKVGQCAPGSLIGEMTVLTAQPASGTAKLAEPSHYWVISARELRALVSSDQHISQAITACFQRSTMAKLIQANLQIESAGGMPDLIKV